MQSHPFSLSAIHFGGVWRSPVGVPLCWTLLAPSFTNEISLRSNGRRLWAVKLKAHILAHHYPIDLVVSESKVLPANTYSIWGRPRDSSRTRMSGLARFCLVYGVKRLVGFHAVFDQDAYLSPSPALKEPIRGFCTSSQEFDSFPLHNLKMRNMKSWHIGGPDIYKRVRFSPRKEL
jgi:hypothetical protein